MPALASLGVFYHGAQRHNPIPKFANSKETETYCDPILSLLSDSNSSDELIIKATRVVDEAASGNFNRDNIRTEPTTNRAIGLCEKLVEKENPRWARVR